MSFRLLIARSCPWAHLYAVEDSLLAVMFPPRDHSLREVPMTVTILCPALPRSWGRSVSESSTATTGWLVNSNHCKQFLDITQGKNVLKNSFRTIFPTNVSGIKMLVCLQGIAGEDTRTRWWQVAIWLQTWKEQTPESGFWVRILLHHLWPGANCYLTFISLCFLTCKIRVMRGLR